MSERKKISKKMRRRGKRKGKQVEKNDEIRKKNSLSDMLKGSHQKGKETFKKKKPKGVGGGGLGVTGT